MSGYSLDMNARAFVEPPVLWQQGVRFIVEYKMYHWCGHPKYGFSTYEKEFTDEEEACKFMSSLGWTPAY